MNLLGLLESVNRDKFLSLLPLDDTAWWSLNRQNLIITPLKKSDQQNK